MLIKSFPLMEGVPNMICVPHDAPIMGVGWQSEQIVLWALCDTELTNVDRTFIIAGTGHHTDDSRVHAYLGTVVGSDNLARHVFEWR